MALYKKVDGARTILTPQEESDLKAEWLANKLINDAAEAANTALVSQIDSEKADLPTWVQMSNAIDNAFPDTAQARIIKKIARPVYTMLKRRVD